MTDNATVVEAETETQTTEAAATTEAKGAETTEAVTTETATEEVTDDWRAKWAGEDKELLKFLGRFHSPDAAVKRFKSINDDIKGGKYLAPLSESPTDEEVAAYRKQLGIPETAEGYLEKLPEGLVVGDDDKPFVEKFLQSMHATNAPPAMVNAALDTYYGIVEEQAAAEAEVANTAKNASIETLREEWGGNYKRNLNIMHGFLDTLPEPVAEAFRNGRGADGVPLGYNADVLKWLTGLALEANPVATVVPGAGANQASAIADEMKQIEEVMRTDRARYNRDEKMQARYRELISANEKIKGQ